MEKKKEKKKGIRSNAAIRFSKWRTLLKMTQARRERDCQVLLFHYKSIYAAHTSAAMEHKCDDALIKPIQELLILRDWFSFQCFA